MDVALLYSRAQVGHCAMDGIQFELNDIISLYTKHDSEQRRFVSIVIPLLLNIIDTVPGELN